MVVIVLYFILHFLLFVGILGNENNFFDILILLIKYLLWDKVYVSFIHDYVLKCLGFGFEMNLVHSIRRVKEFMVISFF